MVPWVRKVIGVNLGGWLVLEPWITPSLFYQFLGQKNSSKVCTVVIVAAVVLWWRCSVNVVIGVVLW